MSDSHEITRLLQRGDEQAFGQLLPIIYDELRVLAASIFRGQFRADHTLRPTALVHEAYIKLIGNVDEISWQSRSHFFGVAARAMRQILVNHAIARSAGKRNGGKTLIALDEAVGYLRTQEVEILPLHEALERLGDLDKRQAEVVELKFFGGLTNEETAEVMNTSISTVKREWEMARSWLYRELNK